MRYVLLISCVVLGGCDAIRSTTDRVFGKDEAPAETTPAAVEADTETPDPAPVSAPAGWVGARTTIAGLGDPSTPGRWMQTPLVDAEVTARVVVPKTGAQAYITLVPAPGPDGGGSRLSVDAMRALLVPFDELVEVQVFVD
ncbi:hypothetical protein [uncultured Ruegeria sp.]|uniref:hypothetical protein n=1 Tax=uncultured Ruegeria sp. TaxID=259304 RepID=UPI00261C76E8|nr:hypothetical protein [uncultured Ruegeria sp.]